MILSSILRSNLSLTPTCKNAFLKTDLAKFNRRFCTVPTHTSQGEPRLNVKYAWAKDAKPKVVKIPMRYFEDRDHVTADDLHKYLVEDETNLRNVGHIRYWKEKDGAFANIPTNGVKLSKLKNNTIELQLEKASSRSETMGPIAIFDANVGAFVDTLDPVFRPRFRAGGVLHSRAYEALISTVGLKGEICVRAQLAIMFKPPFKKLFFHEEIELGRGIDLIVTGFFSLTWVQFKESSGGILMIGYPLGIAAGISYVRGGVLRPLEDAENTAVPDHPIQKEKKPKLIKAEEDDH